MKTETVWLSFVGEEGFRGVSIVEVTDDERLKALIMADLLHSDHEDRGGLMTAAVRKAHETDCNPGGEVAAFAIPEDDLDGLVGVPRHKLLSRKDLEDLGQKPLSLRELKEEGLI